MKNLENLHRACLLARSKKRKSKKQKKEEKKQKKGRRGGREKEKREREKNEEELQKEVEKGNLLIDEESRELTGAYNPCKEKFTRPFLGDAGWEDELGRFIKIAEKYGRYAGINAKTRTFGGGDLKSLIERAGFDKSQDYFVLKTVDKRKSNYREHKGPFWWDSKPLVRKKRIGDEEFYFPTEELIKRAIPPAVRKSKDIIKETREISRRKEILNSLREKRDNIRKAEEIYFAFRAWVHFHLGNETDRIMGEKMYGLSEEKTKKFISENIEVIPKNFYELEKDYVDFFNNVADEPEEVIESGEKLWLIAEALEMAEESCGFSCFIVESIKRMKGEKKDTEELDIRLTDKVFLPFGRAFQLAQALGYMGDKKVIEEIKKERKKTLDAYNQIPDKTIKKESIKEEELGYPLELLEKIQSLKNKFQEENK